jgi:hypothetical protein
MFEVMERALRTTECSTWLLSALMPSKFWMDDFE